MTKPYVSVLEHIEHFESRYKRHHEKYMQAMTEFSVGGLHDEQILNAIAFCECQRIGKYLREEAAKLNKSQFDPEIKKMQVRVTSDIMNFGISDRLPDINNRVSRIVARDFLELLDSLIANQ